MLTFNNVFSGYGRNDVLRDISLQVEAGEIVTLIGANGAGKTTLLMTLCGMPHPNKGSIIFKNQPLTGIPTHKIINKGIAHVPEGRRIFPHLTVYENLQLGAIHQPDSHFREDIREVFQLFPRLEERQHQRGGTLSGGEQQMLAIGRALVSRPELLLLDEPSLGLAPLIIKNIFTSITDINKRKGLTVLLVEQNANLALKASNRGYVLANGVITLQGSSNELLNNEAIKAAYLDGAH